MIYFALRGARSRGSDRNLNIALNKRQTKPFKGCLAGRRGKKLTRQVGGTRRRKSHRLTSLKNDTHVQFAVTISIDRSPIDAIDSDTQIIGT